MVASVVFTQLVDINLPIRVLGDSGLPAAVVVVLVVVVIILFIVVLAVSGGGIAVAAIVVSVVGVEEEVRVVHADLGEVSSLSDCYLHTVYVL